MVLSTLHKIYISSTKDPIFNLAFEEYLTKSSKSYDNILYLWQNENTVVIGRNQNPWKECNWKKLNDDNGKLVRRLSGGGAVYHDLGNLNFTFISADSENRINENVTLIIDALNSVGVNAYFSGKNDILVDGYKISGNAYFSENDKLCHHGTLLIDTNIKKLSSYLKVSKLKLKSKGIDSVKSRVINLNEIDAKLDVQSISNALINTFRSKYSCDKVDYVDNSFHLDNLKEKYNSWEWNFGSSPQFDIEYIERFEWGEVEINLQVEDGVIKDVKVYSDSNDSNISKNIEKLLKDLRFRKEEILKSFDKISDEKKIDLIDWFKRIDI